MTLKKIVLPEGGSERVLSAAAELITKKICHPIVLGDIDKITTALGSAVSYTAETVDSAYLAALKAEAAQNGKEFPVEDASLAHGAALVASGQADGIVAGAENETGDVFRVYVKKIDVIQSVSRVTDAFRMKKADSRLIFANCGLNPKSTAQQLAETAFLAAELAKTEGIEPRIAFLSYQTGGRARHEMVALVEEAARVARETYGLCADGPLQFDAALVPEVAERKITNSPVAGQATIYVFPDLNSGNIGYKIAERLGGYQATGPLFLGFSKPAFDLSRGCSVEDIVRVVKIAVKQAA